MATSGVEGTFQLSVLDLITMSVNLLSVPASQLSADQLRFAQNSLELILKSLPNDGYDRYLTTSTLVGLVPNVVQYNLPTGAQEVIKVAWRQGQINPTTTVYSSSNGGTPANCFTGNLTPGCIQNASNGNISANWGSGVQNAINYVGFNALGTHTYSLVWEYSNDGVIWFTNYTAPSATYTDNTWVYYQLTTPVAAQYYRVRETAGATLSIRQLYFGYDQQDVVIGRINRDDYFSQSQKNDASSGNEIVNFYVQEDITTLTLFTWPAILNSNINTMLVYYYRQPQDVGSLTNTLEIPFRWYDGIVWNLASRMALYLPKVSPELLQFVTQRADLMMNKVTQSDFDRSPVRLILATNSYKI